MQIFPDHGLLCWHMYMIFHASGTHILVKIISEMTILSGTQSKDSNHSEP